ncbi:MAG: extracellular solute-binding protein [Candidatus Moranbacteria bacterium]|nr:extracellular solute-binding protein [Candidatus Moranbacteria bacterium]
MLSLEKIKTFIKNKSKFVLAILAVAIIPFFSGCGTTAPSGYLVNLEIWGTFDDSLVYSEIINQYKQINPYVGEIKYRKFSQDTYRQELLDALASGQGPDIFLVNNGWMASFQNKLEPAPTPLMSDQDMKSNFPDVVTSDFMDGGKAYAVPLSVDSMQLYYNKDMFNAVGITAPPKTWFEFQSDVVKLTRLNPNGGFDLSGAAIGTGTNINRASDLLTLLMLQNGVEFPTKKGMAAKIDEGVVGRDGNVTQAGESALSFYTQFAKLNGANNLRNPFYTWNSRNHNSIDAFSEGTVAMMFNYSWQIAEIKKKNPKLNFAVASVPQAHSDNPVTYANYWGYAVSRNKVVAPATVGGQPAAAPVSNETRTHEAWQFLRFLTLKNSGKITLYNAVTKNSKDFPISFDPAIDYLKKTNQPAARRDIIELQKIDTDLGPFATGNLFAKHWYQPDPDAVDKIFVDTIESVNRGDVNLHEALVLARNRISYISGGSSAVK